MSRAGLLLGKLHPEFRDFDFQVLTFEGIVAPVALAGWLVASCVFSIPT